MTSISDLFDRIKPFFDEIDTRKDELNEDTKIITEIPAPPFKEEVRGNYIANRFTSLGLEVIIDEIGNVIASLPPDKIIDDNLPGVIIAAHLDTVFGEEVDIKVIKEGDKLLGPGVGDDSRGLTNLLVLAEYCMRLQINRPIYFVANVGEEGIGDLRGTKHLFYAKEHQGKFPISSFITIDGTGNDRIVNQSIGSKRYRVHYRGEGGHSYGAYGLVNPGFALGKFLAMMGELDVTNKPKTTYSVGVLKGGTSVNSIPYHVSAEIDLRSESEDILLELENKIMNLANEALKIEMNKRNGELKLEMEMIGDRPAGVMGKNDPLTMIIQEVNQCFNIKAEFSASSTDANIPHNLSIPALGVAGVHKAGKTHSLDEWIITDEESLTTIKRNLLLMAVLIL